jgi:RNA polymerase sigma factor (sigma-70 family)
MPSPTTVLLRTQTDERLVALVRGGHERAFEAIVERYRRPLLRACRRVLPDARAEDAVQQALMAAWNGLLRGDEVRELRPWLYRIAHNTALNHLRVSGYDYDELHEVINGRDGTEEEFERRLIARSTLAGLAALPERQREALLQIAVQGRGQEEVARSLGVSEPAVRQLVHRARTQLRSAATAFVPMPLAAWAASAGERSGPLADRVGELVAGGGAAGIAAAAKTGAVIVLATGAVASPAVVDRLRHGGHVTPQTEARAATARAPAPRAALPAGGAGHSALTAAGTAHSGGTSRAGGDGSSGRGTSGRDDSRGSAGGDSSSDGGSSGGDGSRGGDSRDDDSSGGDDSRGRDDSRGNDDSSDDDTPSASRQRSRGKDGSSDGDDSPGGEGSGGSGSGASPDDDEEPASTPSISTPVTAPPVATPEPDDDDVPDVPEPEHRGGVVDSSEE